MKIIKQLYPEIIVKRNPPKNIKKGEEVLFGGPSYTFTIPATYVYQLNNIKVTADGFLYKRLRSLKNFIVCYKDDFVNYRFRYLIHVLLKYKKVTLNSATNYLIIFDNYSGPKGFAHWLSDGLTRLVELQENIKDHVVLAPYYFETEPLYLQTLGYFGIQRIEFIPKQTVVFVKNATVSDHIAISGNYHPQNVLKLREFIWKQSAVKTKKGFGNRIYVSRSKAGRRFVENEDEVVSILSKLGFVTVYLEDHDFNTQLEIVYHAKLLVSIHGGGLAHLHFMQSGSSVLEFRKNGDIENGMFYSLSDALSIEYYYQLCEANEISTSANNFNLKVDTDELIKNINFMIQSQSK